MKEILILKMMSKLPSFRSLKSLLTLFITFFTACGEETTSKQTVENRERIATLPSYTENALLKAVNQIRSRERICTKEIGTIGPSPTLRWNKFLTFSAHEHSRDMALSDTFSHKGSGTSSDITGSIEGRQSLFSERIHRHLKIVSVPTGENIAVGMCSIEEALDAWLKSPKHCENIMNEEFTDIGIAVVTDDQSSYGIYWTQDFAKIY
jgi:uncharacterized protein YkwD